MMNEERRMTKPHPGIRIDKIPARGIGGLIFALGIVTLFAIGIPSMRWFLIAAVPAGALVAWGLYWWRNQTRW